MIPQPRSLGQGSKSPVEVEQLLPRKRGMDGLPYGGGYLDHKLGKIIFCTHEHSSDTLRMVPRMITGPRAMLYSRVDEPELKLGFL